MYLTAKDGEQTRLQSAVRDKWLPAMAEQPGFLSAAILRPFDKEHLTRLEAAQPPHALEVVSFWRSEQERLDWVARPIHDQVFSEVVDASAKLTYTLHDVDASWSIEPP